MSSVAEGLSPVVVLSGLSLLLASFSFVVALVGVLATIQALRAKSRARATVECLVRQDMAMTELLRRVEEKGWTDDDFKNLRARVEHWIQNMDEGDRQIMHRGLHQSSIPGARQFLKELLGSRRAAGGARSNATEGVRTRAS